MALATATAAAISKPTALALLGLLALGASAMADDQVYIWRDPSGVVRFSSIQQPERTAAGASESSLSRKLDVEPALAVCDANPRAGW